MRNLMRKVRNDRGFTLVELLAVIAILALIGGIALPRYIGVVSAAKTDATKGEKALLQSAIDRYIFDEQAKSTSATDKEIFEALTAGTWASNVGDTAINATEAAAVLEPKYLKKNSLSYASYTIDYSFTVK